MKKLLMFTCTAIMALSLLSGCGSSEDKRLDNIIEAGKIVVATSPDYPPYEFMDPSKTGQEAVVGCDVEFMKYIADQLGVSLEIEIMGFDSALAAVQEGKADLVISGLAYKEDRAKAMQLTDYYGNPGYQGVLVLKEELDNYKTAQDFTGKTVAGQNGSLQYENIVNQLPDAIPEPITNIPDGIMMLRTGKIDALAMSGTSGEQYARNYDDIAMSEIRFETESEGNVIGIRNGEKALYDKINEIIAEVNASGIYEVWRDEAVLLSEEIAND